METNKEITRIPKEDFDSLCPYCKSRIIYLRGEHRADPQVSFWNIDDAEPEIEEWRCAACFSPFILY